MPPVAIPSLAGMETPEQRRQREAMEANERAIAEAQARLEREEAAAAQSPIVLSQNMGIPLDAGAPAVAAPRVSVARPDGTAKASKPAAAAPVVTTRSGPVSVETPLGAGDSITQRTGRGGESRSQREVSDDEKKHQEELRRLEQETIREAEKVNKVRETNANMAAAAAAHKQALTDVEIRQHQEAVKKLEAEGNDEEQKYRQALADQNNARKTFWARQDTGTKLRAAGSILLGIVGGLTDGSNVGVERIEKAIDADEAAYKEKADQQLKFWEKKRGALAEEKAHGLRRAKDFVDLRTAAIYESVAAESEARAARMGLSKEQIANNPGITALKMKAAERKQKWLEDTSAKVSREQAWSKVVTDAGGVGGAGKAPTETDKRYALFGKGMLEDLAVVGAGKDLTPQALAKVQQNANRIEAADRASDKSIIGSLGVAGARSVGVVPKTRYEGLSPREARAMNAVDNAGEKLYRIYTGAGMPAEEARRMVMQGAPHAGDPPEVITEKLNRWDAEARRMMALAGRAAGQVAGIDRAQQAMPTNATPAAAGRRGKVNGKPAMIYDDGTWEPL
jgi:hypothetical protein